MAWMYILKCRDGSYYTGSTGDVERRVWEHNAGFVHGYTSQRRPVFLAYSFECDTAIEAAELEYQIKGWRREKKEALIRGDFDALVALADTRRGEE
jgi:predicted GIY-YIG superfamily endonuclease